MITPTKCRAAGLSVVLTLMGTGCDLDTRDVGRDTDAGSGAPVRRKLGDILRDAGLEEEPDADIIVTPEVGRAGAGGHGGAGAGGAGGMAMPPGHQHPQAGQEGSLPMLPTVPMTPTEPTEPTEPTVPTVPTQPSAAVSFSVPLTKDQETPPCNAAGADASATGSLSVSADGSAVSAELTYSGLSGDPSYAHIHFGAKGAAGPVALDFGSTLSSPIRKTFMAADYPAPPNGPADFAALVQAIHAGHTYFNIHTPACGAGELRGQIAGMDPAPALDSSFQSKLTAAQELQPCAQAAQAALGWGTVKIGPNNESIAIRLSFSGLSGAPVAGHVHLGSPSVNGPILLSLGNLPHSTQVFSPSDYTAPENGPRDFAALIDVIRAEQTYLNIHTDACASGEVRGQILSEE